ncbi:MAG TPA: thiopeptide-type bacteriocin biosynthesis protein [Acidimicrobiales bacterium]|nr:thiopeptide-type bacteriocin biosynthesis protein [Acidimicrobiales bacterium]
MTEHDPALILSVLLRDEDETAALAERRGIPAGALAAWRGAVSDAALAALDGAVAPACWVQADLALPHRPGAAGVLAGALAERAEDWLASGAASGAWHMQKPPGVRLRVEGDRDTLRAAVAAALDAMVGDGALERWQFGAYLPESHLFGGTAGMALAHRFFTADSLAVLAWERARHDGTATLGPAEFSFLLVDSWLGRLVPDPWERWDVWCRLRWAGRVLDQPGQSPADLAPDAVAWVRGVRALPGPWPGASRGEQAILDRYQRRVDALADEVAAAVAAGTLPVHLRQVLPFWIVFHWNRMSFTLEAQRALTRVVIAALDPRGPAVE